MKCFSFIICLMGGEKSWIWLLQLCLLRLPKAWTLATRTVGLTALVLVMCVCVCCWCCLEWAQNWRTKIIFTFIICTFDLSDLFWRVSPHSCSPNYLFSYLMAAWSTILVVLHVFSPLIVNCSSSIIASQYLFQENLIQFISAFLLAVQFIRQEYRPYQQTTVTAAAWSGLTSIIYNLFSNI